MSAVEEVTDLLAGARSFLCHRALMKPSEEYEGSRFKLDLPGHYEV